MTRHLRIQSITHGRDGRVTVSFLTARQRAQSGAAPNAAWRFALQINEQFYFRTQPSPSEQVLDVHGNSYPVYHFEKPTEYPWCICAANFGQGRAYVFVNTEVDPPQGMFLWQR